jgi:hypothetical protein
MYYYDANDFVYFDKNYIFLSVLQKVFLTLLPSCPFKRLGLNFFNKPSHFHLIIKRVASDDQAALLKT